VIVFSPLAQGVLTDRYLDGIPDDSRLRTGEFVTEEMVQGTLDRVRALNEVASRRGQSLAQMAIAWTLRDARVTAALIGASSVEQLEDNLGALEHLDFGADELAEIDRHATEAGINQWADSSAAD
jgi:L-glyceraldehyde 3-phosphate reductase